MRRWPNFKGKVSVNSSTNRSQVLTNSRSSTGPIESSPGCFVECGSEHDRHASTMAGVAGSACGGGCRGRPGSGTGRREGGASRTRPGDPGKGAGGCELRAVAHQDHFRAGGVTPSSNLFLTAASVVLARSRNTKETRIVSLLGATPAGLGQVCDRVRRRRPIRGIGCPMEAAEETVVVHSSFPGPQFDVPSVPGLHCAAQVTNTVGS